MYSQNLIIKIAELYYIYNMTQQQIANRLKISRVKVSRILTNAKKRGIVSVNINYPISNCVQMERQFEKLFSLKEALIIKAKNISREIIYNEVARTAAKYLSEKIKNKDILGVAWGRTLRQISSYIKYFGKKVDIVQMIGSLGSNNISADEIVRRLSDVSSGKYYLLPAPAIVDNKKTKDAIISDSAIDQIFRKMKQITVAIVGIGNLSRESSFMASGYLKENDINFLRNSSSVGEICGRFFNENGKACDTCFNQRVIGIDLEQLRKIPYVIGVVSGSQKAMAILGALRTGVLDVLITDEITALEVCSKFNRNREL